MNAQDLKFFVAVYEQRGFSRAAHALGTVQSNVSTHIRNLEHSLGVRLFERRYRSVVPTESGDKLYAQAKQMLDLLDKAESELKSREPPKSSDG